MSKKKELAYNTIIILLGKISTQFLSFLLLPLYTSCLSTSDYGTVDLIITYISLLVPVITIQQEMAVFRYLIDSRNDKDKIKSTISSSLSIVLLITCIFTVLYLLLSLFIDFKYKFLILINILCCILSNFSLQVARGLGDNIKYSIACFITGLITVISNIVLIVCFKFGADGMLISMILANLLCSIYLFISLKLYKYISFKSINSKLRKKMISYSLPLVPNSISWWVINVSDRTIISLFLGVASNGIYAVSCKFPAIISSLSSIFSMSWTESAALHIKEDDRNEFFSDIANSSLKLFSSVCLLLICIMPFVFNLLIGKNYSNAYLYIPILLLGSLFNCIVVVYSAVYVAKKMTKQVASTSIMSAIINIVINLVFIKFIGLYAAAISTAIAYFAMVIYRHFDVKKFVNISYNIKTVIGIVMMFIIIFTLYYINNLYLNITSLIITCLYVIMSNKNILCSIIKRGNKA